MSLPVSPFWPPSPHHSFSMTPLPLRAGKEKRKKNWPECTDCERVAQQQPSQQPPLCCASCECFINCHLLQEFLKATWFTLRCNKKKKNLVLPAAKKKSTTSDTKVGFWSCAADCLWLRFLWTFQQSEQRPFPRGLDKYSFSLDSGRMGLVCNCACVKASRVDAERLHERIAGWGMSSSADHPTDLLFPRCRCSSIPGPWAQSAQPSVCQDNISDVRLSKILFAPLTEKCAVSTKVESLRGSQ